MNDLGFALRDALRAERAELLSALERGSRVEPVLRGLSNRVDRFVRQIAIECGVTPFAVVIAVGGYGRAELFPHSDVDVLIVHEPQLHDGQRQKIEALIGLLWDLGLHLGHAVRTIEECRTEARNDATILTSLLEARRIVGSASTYRAFSSAIREIIDPQAFYRAKRLEQQQRHTKFFDSPYSLEPNCKESPGGLRDLQILLWIARASGFGSTWSDLVRQGLLNLEEAALLRRTARRLKTLRARLHLVSGRREDRLVFDVQTALAQAAGLRGNTQKRPSELLMQAYYRDAKTVTQLNTIVLLNMEERIFPTEPGEAIEIDAVFRVRRELLDIDDERALGSDPNAILRAFLRMQQHPELKGMTPRLLRALWHARQGIDAAFRRDPTHRATFLAILQQPRGVLHEFRRMNQWSILGRYLPMFRRIVGQMQHDLFHVYTVDQHILMVLRNLRRFALEKHAHEYPLCSQLIADFDKPWLLYVAALFHDIAKGRGGDHSELGARDARSFCRAHGLDKADTDLVVFLVQHHLSMSHTAQKQDLADPAVIDRFARLVHSDYQLVALYLLTVADIRGTSPRVWNAWKARLLEDLFRAARRTLGGGASVPTTAVLESRKQEALRVLRLYGLSDAAHVPLWQQLDVVYFLRHSARDVAWHTRSLIVHVTTQRPIIRTRLASAGEGVEVLMYVRDRKDLFALACGFFDHRSLSILDAKIHTTRHGYALDTFVVSDRGRTPNFRELLARIEQELTVWLSTEVELPLPSKGRLSRQSRSFPVAPAVELQPDEGGNQYVLSLTATDRIGLLYAIAHGLARHGVDVHTAKILTLGERVEDVFLIEGTVLNSPRGQLLLEEDLMKALAP